MRLRNILVTGASRGIGHAITHLLLEKGHTVWGIARNIEGWHPQLHPCKMDLSKPDSWPPLLPLFKEVDTLICNVGQGLFGNLEELSIEQIKTTMDLNFLSSVYLIKELLPHLKKKECADILFIGSEAALAGKRKGTIYCASKFALRGFAQSLRDECSTSSVRVSMIQPGMVRTSFFDPLSFMPGDAPSHAIEPEDVAHAVEMVLKTRPETVFDEILLSPKKKVIQKKVVCEA